MGTKNYFKKLKKKRGLVKTRPPGNTAFIYYFF